MFRLLRALAVIVPLGACACDTSTTVPDMPAGTMLTGDFERLVGRPPMSVRQLLEANREAWAEAR